MTSLYETLFDDIPMFVVPGTENSDVIKYETNEQMIVRLMNERKVEQTLEEIRRLEIQLLQVELIGPWRQKETPRGYVVRLEKAMCYSGVCPYEHSSGPAAGGCSLKDGEPIPYDAACMLAERGLEEWELRHPLRVLAKELRYRLSMLWLELRWRFCPEDQIPF